MAQQIKISVRNLVEFIMKSGDIDTSRGGMSDVRACQEGSRIHRKIQRAQKSGYQAEVPLKISLEIQAGEDGYELLVEGRADGIIEKNRDEEGPLYTVDEIKGIYMDLEYLKEPFGVHLSQAKCYAYIWAEQKKQSEISVQMTYCNLETEVCKYFIQDYTFPELKEWFNNLIREYSKWADWQFTWGKKRDLSIKPVEFPFPYRKGQRELVAGVYRTILREKKVYIQAPTGVGKTISAVYPAVKAMGEGHAEKIFYLTAKTITRTVAEDTFQFLSENGIMLKVVTITAKEKICIQDKLACNPRDCGRAKGHYDRVNDAVYDLLTSEDRISRELILKYSARHQVCPFEMCLDVTTWADAVICDYNYVFDPTAHLKRFFAYDKKQDYVFLIDEAHNLVDRAREMYSAVLYKDDFLEVRRIIKLYNKKLEKALSACNHDLLELRRQCDECEVLEDIQGFVFHLMRAASLFEEFLQQMPGLSDRDKVLELYFGLRSFLAVYEELDFRYIIYTDYDGEGKFRISLKCMDPSGHLKEYLKKGRSAVFFSATLLPIRYYKEQLGGEEEDYAVYAPSPFDKKRRLLLIGPGVSTRYTKRGPEEYKKIASYIQAFADGKKGNYFVFFPSYQLMAQVGDYMEQGTNQVLYMQRQGMSEEEKEEFLGSFTEDGGLTRIGFCVMGGIFGEGIDLTNDRLIGAVIVGTGLPMVCNERELLREYYQEKKGEGFAYAYLYNGMNKVLQSAGRVIRTAQDKGAILLLDERFLNRQYTSLFPMEWFPNHTVNLSAMKRKLEEFWRETDV